MFKKKPSLSNDVLQQAIAITQTAAILLSSISHKPAELRKFDLDLQSAALFAGAGLSGSTVVAGAVATGAAVAGSALAAAATPLTLGLSAMVTSKKAAERTHQNAKAEGIIALLEEQCHTAERYRGMDYSGIGQKGRSILNAIVENLSSLVLLIRE